MNDNEKVIYDAEIDGNDIKNPAPFDDQGLSVYDYQEEINKRQAEIEKERSENEQESQPLSEDQRNVFTDGLNGGQFIVNHVCPMCGVGKKTISELWKRKHIFSKKKIVVGYISICANCGFTSIYGTNVNDILNYLKK